MAFEPKRSHAEALIERIRHVHVYTNELLPDGSRRALFVGPHREDLMGGPVPRGLDAAREWARLVHPEDAAVAAEHAARNRRGESSEVEYRLVGYDGVTRWVHARTEPRAGERRIYDGVVWDVTARREAERELAASHERLETLIANVPGVVYRIGLSASPQLLFLSNAIETMFGYEAAEFLGPDPARTLESVAHPDDRTAIATARAEVVEHGSFALEYRVVDRAGDARWVYEQGQVIADAAGGALLDGIVFDVSDRKHVEAELARMETELRLAQKLEAVGQLAAGMAHEINTPAQFTTDSLVFLREIFGELADALCGYREVALRSDAAAVEAIDERLDLPYLEERVPAAFDRAFRGLGRVGEIVRGMKVFAQPEQSGFAPADVNAAVEATLAVAATELAKAAVEVETELAPLPQVVCSVGDLNQVFLGLVLNAVRAIDEGPRERGTIRVSTQLAGDRVVVRVADDGCGIPPEVAERLFDPFFTTRDVGRGSGQGLAIARAVVDRHAGTISFESEPGVGTTFAVTLPVGGPLAAASASAPGLAA